MNDLTHAQATILFATLLAVLGIAGSVLYLLNQIRRLVLYAITLLGGDPEKSKE